MEKVRYSGNEATSQKIKQNPGNTQKDSFTTLQYTVASVVFIIAHNHVNLCSIFPPPCMHLKEKCLTFSLIFSCSRHTLVAKFFALYIAMFTPFTSLFVDFLQVKSLVYSSNPALYLFPTSFIYFFPCTVQLALYIEQRKDIFRRKLFATFLSLLGFILRGNSFMQVNRFYPTAHITYDTGLFGVFPLFHRLSHLPAQL